MDNETYKGNILKDYTEYKKHYIINNSSMLSDYDILESMLSLVCGNNNLIASSMMARNLLNTFGSIARVISAGLHNLQSINGLSNNVIIAILCIKEILTRTSREEVINPQKTLNNHEALIKYLRVSIGHFCNKECLQTIYLNKNHRVISEQVQEGSIDQIPLYVREIIKHALVIGSTAVIIGNNCTGDKYNLSFSDKKITLELFRACLLLNIKLIDHIIVTPASYFSFKENNIIP